VSRKASLCGHYEVVRHLLEFGALCERDTFQGERCLYNALNDRIRNLLLSYDYSKSTNPLQPLAAHVTSLLTRETPKTSDLTLVTASECFNVHKFVLAARSPYFAKKLATAPDTVSWRLPNTIPSQSLQAAVRFLYLSEVVADYGEDEEERDILEGISKLSKSLHIERLFETMIETSNRRILRQRREDEVNRGRDELETWFMDNVLKHKISIDKTKAADVKWDRSNTIFADVLLRADEDDEEEPGADTKSKENTSRSTLAPSIPIGPFGNKSRSPSRTRRSKKSVLFPAHKAMLLRSEFFATMFSSGFREAQETGYLQIIPIDCSPEVLKIILTFLYTERSDFPLDVAIDVLFTADMLFIDKLKVKAAQIISTLGSGTSVVESENRKGEMELEEVLDIYDVVRAGWDTRVQRLEEFGARYIAYRLERYIDQEEFLELVKESASRVQAREETDTIELIDEYAFPCLNNDQQLTLCQYSLLPL
jgi:ankyrin repeat/BTB/POZ domain-containing protein 1